MSSFYWFWALMLCIACICAWSIHEKWLIFALIVNLPQLSRPPPLARIEFINFSFSQYLLWIFLLKVLYIILENVSFNQVHACTLVEYVLNCAWPFYQNWPRKISYCSDPLFIIIDLVLVKKNWENYFYLWWIRKWFCPNS